MKVLVFGKEDNIDSHIINKHIPEIVAIQKSWSIPTIDNKRVYCCKTKEINLNKEFQVNAYITSDGEYISIEDPLFLIGLIQYIRRFDDEYATMFETFTFFDLASVY